MGKQLLGAKGEDWKGMGGTERSVEVREDKALFLELPKESICPVTALFVCGEHPKRGGC